jgi:hypothetical protein
VLHLLKNVSAFCPHREMLSEDECKRNELINLVEEIATAFRLWHG